MSPPLKKFFLRISAHPQGLEDAARALARGAHRHDVLEAALRITEEDPSIRSVGFGGAPNILCEMELDGAFMDGDTRACGAVMGMKRHFPSGVARKLMESGLHNVLHGEGAERFADEAGIGRAGTLEPARRAEWEKTVKPLLEARNGETLTALVRQRMRPAHADTMIMIASDGTGISGGSTTSGWDYKHPGRAGDTGIIGAGLYVDSRFGGACCTHTGEMATRAGTARVVVERLRAGKSAASAIDDAIEDLSALRGGVLGPLVIYAVDRAGGPDARIVNGDVPFAYQYWREGMDGPDVRPAPVVKVAFRGP